MLNELNVPAIKVNTYQGVADALGAQRGDQITFLYFTTKDNVVRFRFCRVILDPTNADGSQAAMSTPFTVGNAINLPSVRNEGTENVRFVLNETYGLGVTNSGESAFCGGVILSRLLNDNWLRSTCRLTYNEDMGSMDNASMGACLDQAVNGKAIYTPNELYLNNAGQGNSAGVEAGSDVPSGGGSSTTPDTPSGGGSSTPSTGIQSVTIDGANLIAGTRGSAELGDSLVIRFNGAGDSVSVYESTDLENPVAADDPENGKVTISIAAPAFAENTEYRIYVGDSYSNYSFYVRGAGNGED